MSEEDDRQGLPDRMVRLLVRLMNAAGLNGTRLLWKWNRRQTKIGETGRKTELLLRSARSKHKIRHTAQMLYAIVGDLRSIQTQPF